MCTKEYNAGTFSITCSALTNFHEKYHFISGAMVVLCSNNQP